MSAFDPLTPYNALPRLPPRADLETKPVLKACIEARAAIEGLRRSGRLIPNQSVLINVVPFLEAQASSEIENIVTTTDDLFRYAPLEDQASPHVKEALRYRRALREGFDSLEARPLCTATAVQVCQAIKNAAIDVRRIPGTALKNDATGSIIYTPPTGEPLLRDLLANWESFVHNATDLDPLVRMAVQHYQFEAIHPFIDGNGRTGRILNLLALVQLGLLDQPVLYLSRYILGHRADYYRLLLDVTRKGAWEPWILFMLDAVAETATWTMKKIADVQELQDLAATHIRAHAPIIYSRELVDVIFSQPYCRIQNVIEVAGVTRQTASTYLRTLAKIGVLVEEKLGRDKVFIHPAFVRLLTSDHAAQAYLMPDAT